MSALRIASRFAHEPVSGPCARCLLRVELRAGWHAAEPDGPDSVVCDRCAQRDDAGGYGQLLAWRRMRGYCPGASGSTRSAAA